MGNKRTNIIVIITVLAAGAGFFVWQHIASQRAPSALPVAAEAEVLPPSDRVVEVPVAPQSTFSTVMSTAQIDATVTQQIVAAAAPVYDLAKIRPDRQLSLVYDGESDEFKRLIYQIDTEEELFVDRQADGSWSAERRLIPYEVQIKTTDGTIENFLYADALAQGIDERTVIAWADVLQWSIDFANDVRQGDTYRFIYEERFRDGEYVMPGKVLAAKYVNGDQVYYGFYYQSPDGSEGYYDENGNNLQKMFLKAPVAFKYISSGFTTGARYIQAFNISTGHRAIDYAADYGSPIQSVGDGTVTFAGWNGSYGNMVKVRHNGTYSTNYGHMSKIAVKVGQKVSQGETIGYVGSTGLSTGPHVHYEMVKNGVKINPLREVLPPGDPLPDEYKDAYIQSIQQIKQELG